MFWTSSCLNYQNLPRSSVNLSIVVGLRTQVLKTCASSIWPPSLLQLPRIDTWFVSASGQQCRPATDWLSDYQKLSQALSRAPSEGCPTTGGASGCPKCFIQSARNAANPLRTVHRRLTWCPATLRVRWMGGTAPLKLLHWATETHLHRCLDPAPLIHRKLQNCLYFINIRICTY